MPGTLTRSQLLGYATLCLIWGSTWLAIRVVVRDVPPLEAAAIRFIAAASILLAIALLQKRQWPQTRQQWNAVIVLGITLIALPYGLLFWAEQYVTSSMTAVLFSAMPLLVALFTPLMMHQTVPRRAVFSMLVAFGGLLTLFYSGDLFAAGRALIGGVAVLISVVLSAWSVVFAKKHLHNIDHVASTAFQLLFGAMALSWGTWALEPRLHAAWSRPAVLALAFLVVIGSCAAFVVYYWLLKRMQPYQLSTISLITPVIALLEGGLLMHEAIPLRMILGTAVVLGSVGAVLLSSQEQQNSDASILVAEK
jgi:drug/metabolite transporter (DMT)-like permease